jgi:hypothetical protein
MKKTKKPSRASRRAAPPCWTPSDADIRKAVLADIQQFMVDSMTPTRGYEVPISNVKALIRRMTPNEQPQILNEAK